MSLSDRPRHLAIVGPTASGKSALALAIARRLSDVEIVSIDSMQVYRGMDIGTAKPSPAERAEVRHHLVDLAEPDEDFSVARFQAAFREAMGSIEQRGRRAVLVGGTGLYVRAVIDDLTIPGEYPTVRAALEAEADTAALHDRLDAVDPTAAARIERNNRRRIIRALEVSLGSGRPFSSYGPGLTTHGEVPFVLVGLRMPRPLVAERIAARFHSMIAAGLVDEVKRLLAGYPALSRTARQALGYREILAHLEHGVALDLTVDQAIARTRRFAVRQERWFRRDPRIRWHDTTGKAVEVAAAVLGDWEAACPT